MGFEKPA